MTNNAEIQLKKYGFHENDVPFYVKHNDILKEIVIKVCGKRDR